MNCVYQHSLDLCVHGCGLKSHVTDASIIHVQQQLDSLSDVMDQPLHLSLEKNYDSFTKD